MEVTASLLDRVPVGNLRVPRTEFGALWVAAERINAEQTERPDPDWYPAAVAVTCRWLAGAVVQDRTGRRTLAPSPATRRPARAYEELIEADSSAVTTGSGSASLAWRSASRASAPSAAARVPAVWASQTARASSSSCSWTARSSRISARAAASVGLLAQSGALGVVGGGVGFGAAQGGGLAVVGGGLAGAGEFVADVAGSPGLFALPGADAHAQLAVGQSRGWPGRPPGGRGRARRRGRRRTARPARPSVRRRGRRPGRRRGRAARGRRRRHRRAPRQRSRSVQIVRDRARAPRPPRTAPRSAAARPSSAARWSAAAASAAR